MNKCKTCYGKSINCQYSKITSKIEKHFDLIALKMIINKRHFSSFSLSVKESTENSRITKIPPTESKVSCCRLHFDQGLKFLSLAPIRLLKWTTAPNDSNYLRSRCSLTRWAENSLERSWNIVLIIRQNKSSKLTKNEEKKKKDRNLNPRSKTAATKWRGYTSHLNAVSFTAVTR